MLAVVIPYYKLRFFEATLQSLLDQTDKRFRVYIGDDFSPENPSAVIAKFQSNLDITYRKFDNNLGCTSLALQWQRCVTLTQNEAWVMLLCDDDVLSANCVEAFYKNLEEINKNAIDAVRFATDLIDNEGTKYNAVVQHPKFENSKDFLIRRLNGGTRNSLSENIFRKKNIIEIKFKDFPLAWHSDDLALLEFSNFGTLFTINEALVYFRLSELNITNKTDNVYLKSTASFKFFYYLLNQKGQLFTLVQNKNIRKKLEKRFLEDKKNVNYWFLMLRLYAKKMWFKAFIQLLIKLPKSIKKK